MTAFLEHETGPNDRWDLIAYQYYGDANRTSPIVRANRHLFGLNPIPTVLPPGLLLRVPILDPESALAESQLPPWKREAA